MRLDRAELIAGQPVKRVRDLLRKMDIWSWHAEKIAAYFGVAVEDAAPLIAELCSRELLVSAAGDGYYKLGSAGSRFVCANLLKPLTRARADQMVAEFLQRVEAVNTNDELAYRVAEVRVFGSYLDKRKDLLGDVDLAVKLVPHGNLTEQEASQRGRDRADAAGRRFGTYLQYLMYGREEVLRALKARKPHLSIHSMEDLEDLETAFRVLFKARPSPSANTVPAANIVL